MGGAVVGGGITVAEEMKKAVDRGVDREEARRLAG